MNFSITRPVPGERMQLHALLVTTLRDTFRSEGIVQSHAEELAAEIESQLHLLDRDLASNGAEEYFLVAKSGETIVGTIACGPPNEIISTHLDSDWSKLVEIKSVYVLPPYQRRGVGSLLFRAMLRRLTEMRILQYCLDSGYRSAQTYWRRTLGEPTVILEDYWDAGAHHCIWVRPVNAVSSS